MEEKITEALKNYDLAETLPVTLLRESSDNKVFIIGQKNKKILRISKKLLAEDIKFEYEAIKRLADGGIPVPKWIVAKSGDFYTLINGQVVALFDFLEGHHLEVTKDLSPTPTQAFNAGKGLGFMSNTASGFTSTSSRSRNIFSELERAVALADIFVGQFEGGKEFIDQVKEALVFGKSQTEVEGFIHNDYRPSNVFFDDENEFAGIIDFDWSCIGPLVKDLAMAVVEWSFPDGSIEPDFKIFDSFLDGYNSVANHKWAKDKKLYSWIKFATLSDTATYFCDRIDDPNLKKRITRSYMYKKYLFFSKI